MAAIAADETAAVDLLLPRTSGEILAVRDQAGLTALSYAIAGGNTALTARLLEHGAPPACSHANGSTALAHAVAQQDATLVCQLLAPAEGVARLTLEERQQALCAAVAAGNHAIARALLEAGTDPNCLSVADGKSPLAAAVESNDARLAGMLAAGGAAMLCDPGRGSAISMSSTKKVHRARKS
ncbi:MAG: ankyrin repeat domain-containing protein [Flavobacteriaceae bacterium]